MPTAPLPPTRVSRRDALRLGALLTCGFTLAACDSRKGGGGQDGLPRREAQHTQAVPRHGCQLREELRLP